ncbi:MAG: GNAT family N-acetyltransferase [Bacillota bacterium]
MRIVNLEEAQLDLTVYADLYNLIFSDYYIPLTITPERLARQLESGTLSSYYSVVALVEDRPAAMVLAGIEPVTGQLTLQALGVIPELRRQGIGKAMIEGLKERAAQAGVKELSLMVMRTNRRALHFYQQMGFHSVGLRECYILPLPARLPKNSQRLKITRIPSNLWGELGEAAANTPPLLVLVAHSGSNNVGHLVISGEETLVIESLYVQPVWRRRPVGISLLRAALAARPLAQKVRVNYLPYRAKEMRRFLRRLGFQCFCRLEEMTAPLHPAQEGNDIPAVEEDGQEQRGS